MLDNPKLVVKNMFYISKLLPEMDKRMGCTLSDDTLIDLFYPVLRVMRHGIPKKDRPKSSEDVIRDLWIEKQDETKNLHVPDINRFSQIHDISQLQDCMDVVMDFLNSIPYWRLRGNSSEEIGKKELENMRRRGQTPQITIGPNMRAMGIESFEQLQEMAQNRQDFPSFLEQIFASSNKVGRNDPCPCGSGKKYKHCCGR